MAAAAALALPWELPAHTDGAQRLAAAAYHQGLPSVREHGLYAVTERYVADVMVLTARFGAG